MRARSVELAAVRTPRSMPGDREIAISRLFRAERHVVFHACSDPQRLQRWYGLPGIALRGSIGPVEFVPPERIMFDQTLEGVAIGARPSITMTFTEEEGLTRVLFRARFRSTSERDTMREHGLDDAWERSFHGLADLLPRYTKPFTLTTQPDRS